MNVLITGGNGFLGRALVNALTKSNFTIRIIDTKDGTSDLLSTFIAPSFVNIDIRDYSKVLIHVRAFQPQWIIHCAAIPGVRTQPNQFQEVLDTNAFGTLNVLRAAAEVQSVQTVVAVSSSTIYGQPNHKGPMAEDSVIAGMSPAGATSVYAHSKRYMEALVDSFARRHSRPTVLTVRPFSLYGPGMRSDLALARYGFAAMSGCTFTDYGTDLVQRDFTYISDAARAILQLASTVSESQTFNIGSGSPLAVRTVLSRLGDLLGCQPSLCYSGRNAVDVDQTYACTRKLKKALTEFEFTPLDEGLRMTANYLRERYSHATTAISSNC